MFQNFLKQKQNFSIKSKNFGTKPKCFDLFQNFLKQFFLQVLLQPLLALSWPQQHSRRREKVLVNSLLQANWVLVDCRGLESALEAVRVSLEAVRVSMEAVRVSIEALRCLRDCERLEEVSELWECSRGQESASRGCKRTCKKICFKKFWNTSKRFGFVPKFLDQMEKFRFCF